MKLHEAIEYVMAAPGFWLRPHAFKRSGSAYRLQHGMITRVPSLKGRDCGITSDPSLLAGEWEVLEPEHVLMEAN